MYDELIESLRKSCWGESAKIIDEERGDAADVIEWLQNSLNDMTNRCAELLNELDYIKKDRFRVPSEEEYVKRFGTNKQIAGWEKRNEREQG